MKKITLCLLIVVIYGQSAYSQTNTLNELKFMLGDWQGDGWMQKGEEKITFSSQEKIRMMAEGRCIAIEGLGKRNAGPNNDVVHSAFAVITFDKTSNQFIKRGYKLNIESPFLKEREKVFSWSLAQGNGATARFTFDFSHPDEWTETGEYSANGQTWFTYMEIRFKREQSNRLELIQAVLEKDVAEIKNVLDKGVPIYTKDESGYSAIDYAIERYKPEALRLMLLTMTKEFELNPNELALLKSIEGKDSLAAVKIINEGISKGAIDLKGELGSLFLAIAVLEGNLLIVNTLINSNSTKNTGTQVPNIVNPNGSNTSGYTALALAVRWNKMAIAKVLLAAGANANLATKSKYQSTPLMEASRDGNAPMANLLIKHGANVNQRDVYGDTALNWGAYFGGYDYIKVLLENGALCHFVGQSGNEVAKDIAKRQGHTKVVELLNQQCKN